MLRKKKGAAEASALKESGPNAKRKGRTFLVTSVKAKACYRVNGHSSAGYEVDVAHQRGRPVEPTLIRFILRSS